jgi:aminoglycoside phosphotransferase (APT) family kinase protein
LNSPGSPVADHGLRLDALGPWLVAQGLLHDVADDVAVERLAGGTQNVLLAVTTGDRRLVLRSGPAGKSSQHRMVEREVWVLGALARTTVPHPRLIAAELDPAVLGRPFYVMARIEGHAAPPGPNEPGCVPEIAPLADALAALAVVRPSEVGLAGFARTDDWTARQGPKWLAQWHAYHRVADYPVHGLPHVERCAAWLAEHAPRTWTTGLLHGDLHLGNMLFDRDRTDGAHLTAIVDWELATLGDPLLDLAELLVTWPDASGRSTLGPVASLPSAPPSARDLVDAYVARTGRGMETLPWYLVLASFRLGILLDGSLARAVSGGFPRGVADELHEAAVRLLSQAYHLIKTETADPFVPTLEA